MKTNVLCALAAGLSAAPPDGSGLQAFACTVESAVNASTGEPVALPDEPILLSELKRDGDRYGKQVWVDDTHHSEETTHSIDSRTGRYEAVAIRTLHDWGEEHLIRSTGVCTPVAELG